MIFFKKKKNPKVLSFCDPSSSSLLYPLSRALLRRTATFRLLKGTLGPTSTWDSLRLGFDFCGRKWGPATQLTTACMPPGQAGRSLPLPGATCTWHLAKWGSVPRQSTR